ncbi:MAG: hypothetical protein K1X82_10915, partial [Bacteroidia bacterium]|nr:hypothetical protein [Bacteroidia bacterium]
MKSFFTRNLKVIAINTLGFFALLLSSQLATSQCNVVNSGAAAAPSCTSQSLSLGAGQSYNIAYTNGVFYQFSFTNNAQSNGFCVNGTHYTGNPTYLNTLNGALATGIYRSTGTWSG